MTNNSKITITLNLPDASPTANDISNAVRRALTQPSLKDQPLTPSIPLATKGVTVKVRTLKTPVAKLTEAGKIRSFAKANGYTIGTRGRIPRPIIDAYENRPE